MENFHPFSPLQASLGLISSKTAIIKFINLQIYIHLMGKCLTKGQQRGRKQLKKINNEIHQQNGNHNQSSMHSPQRKTLKIKKVLNWSTVLEFNYSPTIEQLIISGCLIDDQSLSQLQKYSWSQLTKLFLHQNKITIECVRKMMKNKELQPLKQIDLGNNQIQDQGLKILVQMNISKIIVRKCSITLERVQVFRNINFDSLTELDLRFNQVRPFGIKLLIKANLTNLNRLELKGNQIGNQGIIHLSKGNWPNLKTISFQLLSMSVSASSVLANANWVLQDQTNCHQHEHASITSSLGLMSAKWRQKTQILLYLRLFRKLTMMYYRRFLF